MKFTEVLLYWPIITILVVMVHSDYLLCFNLNDVRRCCEWENKMFVRARLCAILLMSGYSEINLFSELKAPLTLYHPCICLYVCASVLFCGEAEIIQTKCDQNALIMTFVLKTSYKSSILLQSSVHWKFLH